MKLFICSIALLLLVASELHVALLTSWSLCHFLPFDKQFATLHLHKSSPCLQISAVQAKISNKKARKMLQCFIKLNIDVRWGCGYECSATFQHSIATLCKLITMTIASTIAWDCGFVSRTEELELEIDSNGGLEFKCTFLLLGESYLQSFLAVLQLCKMCKHQWCNAWKWKNSIQHHPHFIQTICMAKMENVQENATKSNAIASVNPAKCVQSWTLNCKRMCFIWNNQTFLDLVIAISLPIMSPETFTMNCQIFLLQNCAVTIFATLIFSMLLSAVCSMVLEKCEHWTCCGTKNNHHFAKANLNQCH